MILVLHVLVLLLCAAACAANFIALKVLLGEKKEPERWEARR